MQRTNIETKFGVPDAIKFLQSNYVDMFEYRMAFYEACCTLNIENGVRFASQKIKPTPTYKMEVISQLERQAYENKIQIKDHAGMSYFEWIEQEYFLRAKLAYKQAQNVQYSKEFLQSFRKNIAEVLYVDTIQLYKPDAIQWDLAKKVSTPRVVLAAYYIIFMLSLILAYAAQEEGVGKQGAMLSMLIISIVYYVLRIPFSKNAVMKMMQVQISSATKTSKLRQQDWKSFLNKPSEMLTYYIIESKKQKIRPSFQMTPEEVCRVFAYSKMPRYLTPPEILILR